MALIINIIFFLVLSALIIKALYETVCGICLIINGIFWHTIAFFLDAIAFVTRTGKKAARLFRKPQPQPKPATYSVMRGFDAYYGSK